MVFELGFTEAYGFLREALGPTVEEICAGDHRSCFICVSMAIRIFF